MGNNLCATWQKGYRDGCDWPPRKDAHLIRLWAEIFEVREENNEILWGRVSDDVVPVNVVCIQDSPETVYQVTAYNRLVEKIFDVYLTQPGTRIIQASDCFVHWRDTKCDREWGLNFTVPLDARRFRECCMSHVCHGLARKALSSESVKVSHPKQKPPSMKVGSNQTSPMTQSRCGVAVARPENDDTKHVLVSKHLHHPSDLQQHCSGIHAVTAAPHNGQQVQVRQVLSVYVDNRCRCGADRHQLGQTLDRGELPASQHRPQSFPVGSGIYAACPELGTGLYNAHLEQENQCCHCLAQVQTSHVCGVARNFSCHYGQLGRHCHVADDNAINQSIYMSAKEARVQLQQHQQLVHDKNQQALVLASGIVRAKDTKDATSKDVAQTTGSETTQPKGNQLLWSNESDHPSANENFSHQRQQQQQVLEVPSWTSTQPPTSSISVDGAELPASFDSVTLKRMLRSLSGSPPLECSITETGSSSEQGISLERSKPSPQPVSPPVSSQQETGKQQNTDSKLNSFPKNGNGVAPPVSNLVQTSMAMTTKKSVLPDGNLVSSGIFQEKELEEKTKTIQGTAVTQSTNAALQRTAPVNRSYVEATIQPPEASSLVRHEKSSGTVPSNGQRVEHAADHFSSGPSPDQSENSQVSDVPTQNATSQEPDAKRIGADEAAAAAKEVMHSDSGHVGHQRMDSGSWMETPEVRRLTMSDLSGSDCGSDGEGATSECSSIYTVSMQTAFVSPSLAQRKTGWLMVKNWLVHRKRSVELASKRTWNKYWVSLKGNVLLFHVCDDGEEVIDDRAPKYKLVLEGALAQAVPEHPKKENIFSLSTAFGDAYLLQATNPADLNSWINVLHTACASSLFRQHGKDNILRLLQNEIHRMESSIDLDLKMKKMATMHLMTVSEAQSRHAIDKQITQWEENLEKLYVEHYRLRCYMSSMKNTEPPNPKTLLSYVSKNTKAVLGRVGVFTVNAFHALVCARAPLSTNASVSSSQKARCLLSTFKADTLAQSRAKTTRNFGLRPGPLNKLSSGDGLLTQPGANHCSSPPSKSVPAMAKSFVRVRLSGTQMMVTAEVNDRTTVQDLMDFVCKKQGLNVMDHFLQLKLSNSGSIKIPDRSVQLCAEEYDLIELCMKLLFQIELVRSGKDKDFGFKVEAELMDDLEHTDNLCIFISEITRCGMAYRKGLVVGDEILVINGLRVTQLDVVFIESMLQDLHSLCFTVRSCRVDRPHPGAPLSVHDQLDPPCHSAVTSPASSSSQVPLGDRLPLDTVVSAANPISSERSDRGAEIPDLLRTKKTRNGTDLTLEQMESSQKVNSALHHMCRHQLAAMKPDALGGSDYPLISSTRPLSNSQRICKVILELIDTERLYVRDLMCLIERYLEPLKQETYLSCDDINQLFGNIQEIVQFQKLFLHSLEEAVSTDPNFNMSQEQDKFKDEDLRRILVLICSSFLYYAHHFKLYSSFCASHSKAQKMILSDDNVALQEFLKSRNPKQQHSATLESYLIKPIQRIVKYPLLLKQLYELTDPQSEEHFHLREALHGMEAVAEHINEMQKIYEEYGSIFEELMRHHKQGHGCNKGIDLNVGELQMYGTVNWINAIEELGKIKKSTDLLTLVFIFKSAIVLLAQERQKFKKKAKASAGRPSWGCESSESTRFKLAIPVDQLQVRTVVGDANDRHGIWEIVHCHNEKEGRPKKVYQFISSHKARNDFIRTIHHTMHESVRRISVASLKTQASRLQQSMLRQHMHQSQHQHQISCKSEMDNASSKDANSNVADQVGWLDLSAQPLDFKDGCAFGASSPVRRGPELQPGTEPTERGASAVACSTSPTHRSRQHPRVSNAPTTNPTSLSPRQTGGAK